MIFVAGAFPGGLGVLPALEDATKVAEHKAVSTKQAAYLKAGTAPTANFRNFAEGLNQFLNSIDSSADLMPEAPATLVQKLN